jgi:hypothetical protein
MKNNPTTLPEYAYTINDNYEFQCAITVSNDADNSPLTYYAHRTLTDENTIEMVLFFTEFTQDRNHDDDQITCYINESIRNWHRSGSELEAEEVIDYTFNGSVDPITYSEKHPFVLYFQGCDDGHFYLRFETEIKRAEFVEYFKTLSFDEIEEIFYPSESLTDIMVFRDN